MRYTLAYLVMALSASLASAKTIYVSTTGNNVNDGLTPATAKKTVQAGHDAASAGDTIEIASGTYVGSDGWVGVSKNNLTFRGTGPTRPILDANHSARSSKGIFVVGSGCGNITIENLVMQGAWIPAGSGYNAAGIRYQPSVFPATLTARNCRFYNNQDGALTDGGDQTDVVFEYCEFEHNGAGDGQSHNMYIGTCRNFTLQYCYVHDAVVGHEVKTRARNNYILYNLLSSENGSGSRELQLANGGTAYVIGNVIQQGPNTQNSQIITYADEGNNPNAYLYIVNNTIINRRPNGATFLSKGSTAYALFQNNIVQWYGNETLISGSGVTQVTNWITTNAGLANIANHDYSLTVSSTGAINTGTAPGLSNFGYSLVPTYQPLIPCDRQTRPTDGAIDIGAFEFFNNQPPTVNAGTDQEVIEGQAVHLHAAASDPNGDPLTYAWTQSAGLAAFLNGASTADASFTAPTVTTRAQAAMTFTCTVSDGKAMPVSDSVNIRVRMLGDINRDDAVDSLDLATLSTAWGETAGQPGFDPLYDLNGDGSINVLELLVMAQNWQRTLP